MMCIFSYDIRVTLKLLLEINLKNVASILLKIALDRYLTDIYEEDSEGIIYKTLKCGIIVMQAQQQETDILYLI